MQVRAGSECRVCGKSDRAKMKNRSASPDGHEKICKDCARAEAARYRAENPERLRESRRLDRERHAERRRAEVREWRARNPEKHAARQRRYYDQNVETLRERARGYYAANSERARAATRAWKALHPIEVAGYRRAYKAKARVPGRATTAALATVVEQLGIYGCAVCYGPAEHIDHIVPVSRGGCGCVENLQWLCAPCNLSKGARDFFAWLPERLAALEAS